MVNVNNLSLLFNKNCFFDLYLWKKMIYTNTMSNLDCHPYDALRFGNVAAA